MQLREKTPQQLAQEAQELRVKIASLQLEHAVNPPKDTNEISRLKRKLAVVLTIQRERELQLQQQSRKT